MKHASTFLVALAGCLVGGLLVHWAHESRSRNAEQGTQGTPTPTTDNAQLESLASRLDAVEESVAPLRLERTTAGEVVLSPALARAIAPLIARAAERMPRTDAPKEGDDESASREVVFNRSVEQLDAPHEDTRRSAIRTLHRMFAAEASARVLPMLDDPSPLVRREAAAYFEDMWDPAALEPLVAMMNSGDTRVSESALDALCKSGQEEAIVELERYCLDGEDVELAYEAGKALEENHRVDTLPRAVDRFRSLASSADAKERRFGVLGVGRWGLPTIDEALIRSLTDDSDERVRAAVRRVLEDWQLPTGR